MAPGPWRCEHRAADGDTRELTRLRQGYGGQAFAARSGPTLIGVIVYARPALSLVARDRATGGRYRSAGLGRTSLAALLNREVRLVSRVVITPNWRGLGLASRPA